MAGLEGVAPPDETARGDDVSTTDRRLERASELLTRASADLDHYRAELARLQRLSELLLEVGGAVIVVDGNLRVRTANQEARQLLGLDADAVDGAPLRAVLPEADRVALDGEPAVLTAADRRRIEARAYSADPDVVLVLTPID